ncbi:MAG: hypothetical protein C0465_19765 [Ralstonia sp.]|jgi:hypothetical protein|uniref:Virulence factor n=3 Tax=Pseudomonadota TaxID=1224 RepID=A0ABM9ISZ8_RALPI|nr:MULTISPECIES: hypothetical protein [Ralstonia]MBA4202410.1 hypothetical protein [Ralstonia sp.]MBA4232838.1 hypothetical protein [Ralstonia sp.]MBA4238101.1 hypothetical protein [Ralstonia sp.]MBA4278046.1 hypothetical protein [Ralstonia sp.]MBA4297534.1 hypothetical protein [Ralstonia sp.]
MPNLSCLSPCRRALKATRVLAAACLLLTVSYSGVSMSANDSYSRKPVAWPRMQAAAQADPKAPAAVLLGVQWINPLMWRDYPTQWNLLWAQGLAQPNANDRDAARFKLGDAVGELTLGLERKKRLDDYPQIKRDRFWGAYSKLLSVPLSTFSYRYFNSGFYSMEQGTDRPDFMDAIVFAGMPREWIGTPTYLKNYALGDDWSVDELLKEQAAMGMPAPSYLAYDAAHAEQRMQDYWVKLHKDPKTGETVRGLRTREPMIVGESILSLQGARRLMFDKVADAAFAKSMKYNPSGKLPQVVLKAGDETVGFYDLQEALKFLADNPNKLVWVWNMDAPNYPMGEQTNENTALLILGHPSANWGYAPLASIYTPQHHEGGIGAKAANPGGAWTPLMKTLREQASQDHPVERVYHDVHKHTANINALMGPLHAAVHQQWPDLDQVGNFYSVSQVMEGPARAASFAVNAAFAAAYANQSGKSAVVTSVADAKDSWAVLIGPPPGWQPTPPITQWDRARGEGRAYWPWFGKQTGDRKS